MKPKLLTLTAIAGLSGLVGAFVFVTGSQATNSANNQEIAQAQVVPGGGEFRRGPMRHAQFRRVQLVDTFDSNKDGKITQPEVNKFRKDQFEKI